MSEEAACQGDMPSSTHEVPDSKWVLGLWGLHGAARSRDNCRRAFSTARGGAAPSPGRGRAIPERGAVGRSEPQRCGLGRGQSATLGIWRLPDSLYDGVTS